MSLPPSVRKDVALRLLESLEVIDQQPVDDEWSNEIAARVDDLLSGTTETIPGEQVFAELAARRAARHA